MFSGITQMINDLQKDLSGTLITLAYVAVALLFSLILHECAHGWVAYKCGDPTAKMLGRLTLNPAKHLDPLGTICMVFLRFGWAKPVPINPRNFRHFRRDYIKVSLAGIVVNLMLCILSLLVAALISKLIYEPLILDFIRYNKIQYVTIDITRGFTLYGTDAHFIAYNVFKGNFDTELLRFIQADKQWLLYVQRLFLIIANMNISLAIFNLIPVPPLDGYRFLDMFVFKGRLSIQQNTMFIIQIAFFVLLMSGLLTNALSTAIGYVNSLICQVIGLII